MDAALQERDGAGRTIMELRKREHALERELLDARKENKRLTGTVQQYEARVIAAEQAAEKARGAMLAHAARS